MIATNNISFRKKNIKRCSEVSEGMLTQYVNWLTEDPLNHGKSNGGEADPGVEGVEVGDGRAGQRVTVKHCLQPQPRQHRRTSKNCDT